MSSLPPPGNTRALYDHSPYPASDVDAVLATPHRLPMLPWLLEGAQGLSSVHDVHSVLVAGCGSGAEVINLAKLLPGAHLTGLDFSEKSIDVAQKAAKKAGLTNTSFQVADLQDPGLAETVGRVFDLVTCHGVIDYIPDHSAVAKNIARLLSPGGVAYLGCNGSRHPSSTFRAAFSYLGLAAENFLPGEETRLKLRLLDALAGFPPTAAVSAWPDINLRGDLFGGHIHNLRLAEWIKIWENAGLHLQAAQAGLETFGRLSAAGRMKPLLSLSHADLYAMMDAVAPATFHKVTLRKTPYDLPPWTDPEALAEWAPGCPIFNRWMLPNMAPPWNEAFEIEHAVHGILAPRKLKISRYVVELLRLSDGQRSLQGIMAAIPFEAKVADIVEALFLLQNIGVLTLNPPARHLELH